MRKTGNREQATGNRLLRVAVLAASVAGISIIAMGAQGCGSDVHKASVAAASIGASLQAASAVNHDLIASGAETQEEGAAVAAAILHVARANDVFAGDLKAMESSGTPWTTNAQILILADFSIVENSVDALENGGVLGIKNPAAAARYQAVIADIKAQIAIVKALLGSATASRSPERNPERNPGRNRLPGFPAGLVTLGLALTPEEIEELIALAIAAGSGLVSKLQSLRGEPDPELLASALASDQAAEAQAIADGAKQT